MHGKDVNWVAKVQRRCTKRLAVATKNPPKLGPIALRQQVECLCELMENLANGTSARHKMPRNVNATEKEVDAVRAAEASAVKALQAMKKKYADAMEVMTACSDEELANLELESNATTLEQKRLFREGKPSEYKAQAEVVRNLSEKLVEMQEA